MAEQSGDSGRYYTEDQIRQLIKGAVKDRDDDIARLSRELRDAEFRCRVAEWAVAGLMSRNLHLKVAMPPYERSKEQDAIDLARALGARAGAQFMHAAELAFKDHADFSDLKSRLPPHALYMHYSTEGAPNAHPASWPRPFK